MYYQPYYNSMVESENHGVLKWGKDFAYIASRLRNDWVVNGDWAVGDMMSYCTEFFPLQPNFRFIKEELSKQKPCITFEFLPQGGSFQIKLNYIFWEWKICQLVSAEAGKPQSLNAEGASHAELALCYIQVGSAHYGNTPRKSTNWTRAQLSNHEIPQWTPCLPHVRKKLHK